MQTGVITLDNGNEIRIEFYPDDAPKTVENFVTLAKKGFYDNLTFHRVVPDFVVQGGDPKGNGTGGPGYTIKAEFNKQKHVRGSVAMARSQHPDSAGSQFYITYGATPHLDGQYTVFGASAGKNSTAISPPFSSVMTARWAFGWAPAAPARARRLTTRNSGRRRSMERPPEVADVPVIIHVMVG